MSFNFESAEQRYAFLAEHVRYNKTTGVFTRKSTGKVLVPVDSAKFKQIGGVMTKHNRYDGFQRMAGFTADGRLVPVTRKIEYKSNPSKHVCSAKCRNATGHVCECECGGRYHGVAA